MIDDLIIARTRWDDLDNCIYNLAGGEIGQSRFAYIYDNYEKLVLSLLIQKYPHRKEFLEKWFSAMILDIVENGYTKVKRTSSENEVRHRIFCDEKTVEELFISEDELEYEGFCI